MFRFLFLSLKRLLIFSIFLSLPLFGAYAAFCHRVGDLSPNELGSSVIVVGKVTRTFQLPSGGAALYELQDLTGSIEVVSRKGAPKEGALLLVQARLKRGRPDRPVLLEEKWRLGTF